MTRKYKQDPITGVIQRPLLKIIPAWIFIFSILITNTIIFPYTSHYYLYISIPIGLLGFAGIVWLHIKPNLYARFLHNIGFSALFLIAAYRALDCLIPQFSFLWKVLLISLVVFAHTLPMWNTPLACFIRDEFRSPKTKTRKIILRISLSILPTIVAIYGAAGALYWDPEKKSVGLILLILFSSLYLAVSPPYWYRYPSSPWEAKNR